MGVSDMTNAVHATNGDAQLHELQQTIEFHVARQTQPLAAHDSRRTLLLPLAVATLRRRSGRWQPSERERYNSCSTRQSSCSSSTSGLQAAAFSGLRTRATGKSTGFPFLLPQTRHTRVNRAQLLHKHRYRDD